MTRYANESERARRAAVYEANRQAVRAHNAAADAGNHTFWMALNEWTDLTHREWVEQMMMRPTALQPHPSSRPVAASAHRDPHVRQVPAKVDWTSGDTCKQASGCVTSVKNQGYCGRIPFIFFLFSLTTLTPTGATAHRCPLCNQVLAGHSPPWVQSRVPSPSRQASL